MNLQTTTVNKIYVQHVNSIATIQQGQSKPGHGHSARDSKTGVSHQFLKQMGKKNEFTDEP
jgi:hypothetical protein